MLFKGILMFFGSKENGLVAGDVGYLLKGVNQILNYTAATSSLPCLEPGMPCWRQKDLMEALGAKGFSKKEVHLQRTSAISIMGTHDMGRTWTIFSTLIIVIQIGIFFTT